jgi:hypothetical protein
LSRRRSRAEADRLVSEFERSGLRRKEFCAARGLTVHTLDAWRRRMAQSGTGEKIVPVEIVADRAASTGSGRTGSEAWNGQFRIVLADGLRIEVELGFDAAELRRLIAVLNGGDLRSSWPHPE